MTTRSRPRRLAVAAVALVLAAAVVPDAPASGLIDRDARNVTLKVDGNGFAVVSYRVGKRTRHVLAWAAINDQVKFRLDWVYRGKYHHLFGRYFYNGKAVHGTSSTAKGVPLDPYGRNVYLDVYGSAYGVSWARENSFLTHKPAGTFCYGFYPRRSYYDTSTRPAGHGIRYRATAIGPGVAPDPYWEKAGLGDFDAQYEADMNTFQDELMANDRLCRQH